MDTKERILKQQIFYKKKSIAEEQLNASTIDFLKEFFYLKRVEIMIHFVYSNKQKIT